MKKTIILIFFRKLLILFLLVAGVYAEDCKVCELYKYIIQNPDDSYQLLNFKSVLYVEIIQNPDDSYQLLNLNINGDIVDTLEEDLSEGLVTFTRLIKKFNTGYIVINSYIDAIIKNGKAIGVICPHDYWIQTTTINSSGSDNGCNTNAEYTPGAYALYLEKFTN